ncbi:MAG: hypothetical protein FWD38_02400 [Oscillospiraceae bacterium]|nr:hypothetical protein [Oscillospiraceae bacterium]
METPVGAPLGEKIRIEIKKLREMTFKQKIEHIWEYYKPLLITIVIVVALTASLLNAFVFNPSPKAIIFISWNGGLVSIDHLDELLYTLEDIMIDEDVNEEIILSQMLVNEDDLSMVYMNNTRLAAMIASRQIDAFINSPAMLDMHSVNGFLRPVDDDILAAIKALNPGIYMHIEENFVHMHYELADGSPAEGILAVNIGKSPLLTRLGFFEQDLFYSIAAGTERLNIVMETLIVFFE